jgi:2,4-dienoyl-CoA reductase-like NADH-dependent reductase (Old Yellow Enzyme family)
VTAAFVAAARRAARIGFDVVELHAAHGYLMHEFLSPISNRRDDGYGGSLANHMRLPLEIARAVREALPAGIALGTRISGTDWFEGGWTIEDSVVLAAKLKQLGVDYICVSSGGNVAHARIPLGPGYQVPLAAQIRREAGIATRAVGLISSPEQAEAIVAEGKADMVALARAFLDDPRWGWHAADRLGGKVHCPPQYLRARPPAWTPVA